ncbi:uncharacterized protein LOC122402991 [Colletes gigas]|uniref:uncharacterized protein LOC122402991 n=1 Tax=Colletes gigas TaxID=935657 RepID=UPI001C9AB84F|nr:uncharacterized protein LOC122402991 [Colletes gigas]
MKVYLVTVVVCMTTMTATLESDSHGNRSNEKALPEQRQKYEQNRTRTKQETKNVQDRQSSVGIFQQEIFKYSETNAPSQPEDEISKLVNDNENNYKTNETYRDFQPRLSKQIVQPYLVPSETKQTQENTINGSTNSVPRSSRTPEGTENLTSTVITVEKVPFQQIALKYSPAQQNNFNLSQLFSEELVDFGQRLRSPIPKPRTRSTPRKTTTRPSILNNISPETPKNSSSFQQDLQKAWRLKENQDNASPTIVPATSADTVSSTTVPALSLGKFSGPIVVPDLPRQGLTSKPSFLTASQVVLRPLQVGVALMNAGEDLNSVQDSPEATLPEEEVRSDLQNDQSSLHTESLALKSGQQSVEIQKSVEIFHTAPVHEIHYPLEFVPPPRKPQDKKLNQPTNENLPVNVQENENENEVAFLDLAEGRQVSKYSREPPRVLEEVRLVPQVIEKQITIPHPFPVHVDRVVEKQIRIPYPVHVEKKMPFAVQRFILPFPVHFRIPPSLEKPHLLENGKLFKSIGIPVYNDANLQQIFRHQSFQTMPGPSYGSLMDDQGSFNSTQYYGLGYAGVSRQPLLLHSMPNKFGTQYSQLLYSPVIGHSAAYGRPTPEKESVTGPRKMVQASPAIQSKSLQYASDGQMRRTRQETGANAGTFRQSKMEYGFKPPMVPSVQYDEQTATKVE